MKPKRGKAEPLHHRPEWVGSPSTNTHLSFSSSANRHIRNRQEIPYLDDDEQTTLKKCGRAPAMNSWGKKQICPIKQLKSQEDIFDPRSIVDHPKEWVGSPSSFKTMPFSRTVIEHPDNHNRQDIPKLDPTNDHRITNIPRKRKDPSKLSFLQELSDARPMTTGGISEQETTEASSKGVSSANRGTFLGYSHPKNSARTSPSRATLP